MTALPRDFGRYRLTSLLGSGGMAEVYRAETHPIAGITRPVAIKRILADARTRELEQMLLDETRIWVRLQHPNIVSVLDFGEIDGDWFLALELVEGMTAAELVRATGPLAPPVALCIAERVAKALSHAHALEDDGRSLGIVHRDVKPANILVSIRGEVKLTDFGIARATDRVSRTQAGIVKGSLPYLSPEQVRAEDLDGRSDLFALGCTLHWLLTGSLLVDKPREAAIFALARNEVPAPDPSLPPAIREFIASLTAADRRKRPATAADVGRQLRAMLLPSSVEDVEATLASLVRSARAPRVPEAPPPPEPSVTREADPDPEPTDTLRPPGPIPVAPSALPTVRRAEAPPRPRPATVDLRRLLSRFDGPTFALGGAAVVAVLAISFFAGKSALCESATTRWREARIAGTFAERHDAVASMSRACKGSPALRVERALAARRAGAPAAEAERALRDSPAERRTRELLRIDGAGWPSGSRLSRVPEATEEDSCLQAAVLFDTGELPEVTWPVSPAAGPCVFVLRGSRALSLGDIAQAERQFAKARTRLGAQLGLAAVAFSRKDGESAGSRLLENAIRQASLGDESMTGLWIPASYRPLPGERGRVTTSLDDVQAIASLLEGDRAARDGQYDLALHTYRAAGEGSADVAARMADLAMERRDPAAMGIALARWAESDLPPAPVAARLFLLQVFRQERSAARRFLERHRALLAPETVAELEERLRDAADAFQPQSRPYGPTDANTLEDTLRP